MPGVAQPRARPREPWPHEQLLFERALALSQARALQTRSSYSTALRSYLSFCDRQHLPIAPSPDTLSLGICSELEPFFPDVRSARSSHLVRDTLKGAMRLYSRPVRRKTPLTCSDVARLATSVSSPPSHDDTLFVALLLTGFHALARLGDLVWPDHVQHRTYATVARHLSVHVASDHYTFLLQTHKTDAFFEGDRVLVRRQHPNSDPWQAFTAYLASRDHLFPYRSELWLRADGSIPLRSWFIRHLTNIFPPSANISGHSMRAGGATALALAGISSESIRSIGRWSSAAWQVYIRKHPALLHALLSAHQNPAVSA